MRVLIMGASGLLGHTLAYAWKDTFEVDGTIHGAWKHICQPGSVSSHHPCREKHVFNALSPHLSWLLRHCRPDVVVNCIGIVKQRPSSVTDMIEVNSLFPHRLSKVCKQHQARLIHISTDCVFSGTLGLCRECERPDPVDTYGMTKLLGELPYDLTIRTSFVGRELPGREHHGLWEWLRGHSRETHVAVGPSVPGYIGVSYSGLVVLELANVLRRIILDWPWLRGLYHVASEDISKHLLLRGINEQCNLGLHIAETRGPPKSMTLDSTAFQHQTGYEPPTWAEQISQYHDWTKTLGIYDE